VASWADLKNRKLAQWVLVYLAGAGVVWQAIEVLGERWGLTAGLARSLDILLIAGVFATLILAWYHGEKGRQRVSGPELLMFGGLVALTLIALTLFGRDSENFDGGAEAQRGAAAVSMALRKRPAIAVLPFENLSAQQDNEYFTSGIHDDLLMQLSKISALDVIARTSVLQYAGTEKAIPVIGGELGVEAVVEGTVQRVGDRVRINVQLTGVQSNRNMWAQTYDRELSAENIFAIQSDIAQQIADELRATLTLEEGSRIEMAATGSLAAYDLYLRGKEAYNQFTSRDNSVAVLLFREALEVDSEYARAWAGLGDAFGQRVLSPGAGALSADLAASNRLGNSVIGIPWADSAMAAGRRAIAIDEDLADGYATLGYAYTRRGEAEQARRHLLRAIELDPSHLAAVSTLADLYFKLGEFEEFHHWSRRAFRLDPNYRRRQTQVAWSYWDFQEYDLAEQWARKALSRGVDASEALTILSALASTRGDFARGMQIADSIVDNFPTSSYSSNTAAWAGPVRSRL